MYNLKNQMCWIGFFVVVVVVKASKLCDMKQLSIWNNFSMFCSWLHINECVAFFLPHASEHNFYFQLFLLVLQRKKVCTVCCFLLHCKFIWLWFVKWVGEKYCLQGTTYIRFYTKHLYWTRKLQDRLSLHLSQTPKPDCLQTS